MDILGWDCSAPDDDFTDDNFTEHDPPAVDGGYDLWDLNCCIMRDAYSQGNLVLWNRVLAHWDKILSPTTLPASRHE